MRGTCGRGILSFADVEGCWFVLAADDSCEELFGKARDETAAMSIRDPKKKPAQS